MYSSIENQNGIGLVLSGGGARGLAHIGVLMTLERSEIPISFLAGTSMGGIIATLYAAGWEPESLKAEAKRMSEVRELIRLVDIRPPRRGLLAGENVREYLAQFIDPELTFSDLKVPVALKAVDLNTGGQVDLVSGNVLDAVLATSAFPGIFPHIKIGEHYLVDGGVLNNIPLDLLNKLGIHKTVAVDVSPQYPSGQYSEAIPLVSHLPLLAQDIYRTVVLMINALTTTRIDQQPPDLLIRPDIPFKIGTFSGFTHAEEIIQAGQKATEQRLTELNSLVTKKA